MGDGGWVVVQKLVKVVHTFNQYKLMDRLHTLQIIFTKRTSTISVPCSILLFLKALSFLSPEPTVSPNSLRATHTNPHPLIYIRPHIISLKDVKSV